MTSTVQIAHTNPTPAGTAAVKRLHDLAGGTLVVYPTPGRGGEGIARGILHALGKRFHTRAPRDPRKLEALAALWLRAHPGNPQLLVCTERREGKATRKKPGARTRLCGDRPSVHHSWA